MSYFDDIINDINNYKSGNNNNYMDDIVDAMNKSDFNKSLQAIKNVDDSRRKNLMPDMDDFDNSANKYNTTYDMTRAVDNTSQCCFLNISGDDERKAATVPAILTGRLSNDKVIVTYGGYGMFDPSTPGHSHTAVHFRPGISHIVDSKMISTEPKDMPYYFTSLKSDPTNDFTVLPGGFVKGQDKLTIVLNAPDLQRQLVDKGIMSVGADNKACVRLDAFEDDMFISNRADIYHSYDARDAYISENTDKDILTGDYEDHSDALSAEFDKRFTREQLGCDILFNKHDKNSITLTISDPVKFDHFMLSTLLPETCFEFEMYNPKGIMYDSGSVRNGCRPFEPQLQRERDYEKDDVPRPTGSNSEMLLVNDSKSSIITKGFNKNKKLPDKEYTEMPNMAQLQYNNVLREHESGNIDIVPPRTPVGKTLPAKPNKDVSGEDAPPRTPETESIGIESPVKPSENAPARTPNIEDTSAEKRTVFRNMSSRVRQVFNMAHKAADEIQSQKDSPDYGDN